MPSSTDKPVWRRAGCTGGNCVEVARAGERYLIRSSTTPAAEPLSFSADEWHAFVEGIKKDEFRFE